MPGAGRSGAAFFDLDRTLISRSSSLALAGTFRSRGLIGRRQLTKAVLAQLLFSRFGAGQARVGQTADSAMSVLRGLEVGVVREITAEAWEPVLKPLVYREALDRAAEHADEGEPVFIASAALQEVVAEISDVRDGVFTGRLEKRLYGDAKAAAVVELAEQRGFDLASSTAYSDSYSDVPFLEAVGRPVAVNPDRELRRLAERLSWPVLHWRTKAFPSG
jgi:HAD superfamily hydrolase (TIGR01490 family)